MNILILQGSPRANGNTAWMAEEYRKAAEAAGHKVSSPAWPRPSRGRERACCRDQARNIRPVPQDGPARPISIRS